jgi:hypothetical protein
MFQKFLFMLVLFYALIAGRVCAQEKTGITGFDFDKLEQFDEAKGLPKIYYGVGFDAGKYRETDYSQMLYGVDLFVGVPVDNILSAECYFDFHFHSPNEYTLNFWKYTFGLRPSVPMTLPGFRIIAGGARLRWLLFKHWEWLFGGGFGGWGFNLYLNDKDYGRYSADIYEAEIATGYSRDISEKWFFNIRLTFKNYFIDKAERHEMAWIVGFSLARRWFRKGY